MKKSIVCLVCCILSALCVFSQHIEKGVLEEYNGRSVRTPLTHVELKAYGCNWTITDDYGHFQFSFRKRPEHVSDFQFIKDGYVIFNKDAIKQWRPSVNSHDRFRVVLCLQKDLIRRVQEYQNVFDNRLKILYEKQKEEINNLKIDLSTKNKRLADLEEEFIRKAEECELYANKFARIDEYEINDEHFRALTLFREGKIDEALLVYQKFDLGGKIDSRLKKSHELREDYKNLLPMLLHQAEMYKLSGSRDTDSLIISLNRIVNVCHELNDTTYNHYMALSLYDLGTIYEPSVVNSFSYALDGGAVYNMINEREDVLLAETYFKESAKLGYPPAMYKLARLYECSNALIYDLTESRYWYNEALIRGYVRAGDRLADFFDFGQRNDDGIMLYYKIIKENKKERLVKLTYKDVGYRDIDATESPLRIPSVVYFNGKKYNVNEIGRSSLRTSDYKEIYIPEGVEIISEQALRSSFVEKIHIPSTLKFIAKNTQECNNFLKEIILNKDNKKFKINDLGDLVEICSGNVVLSLNHLAPDESYTKTIFTEWEKGDSLPFRINNEKICISEYYYDSKFPSCIFPKSLETISANGMYYTGIRTLSIPKSIREIMDNAFICNNYLTDIVVDGYDLGLRSRSFASSAFSDLYIFSQTPPHADKNTFEKGRAYRTLHVVTGAAEKYRQAQGWSTFTNIKEDLNEENPFYNALRLRSDEEFIESYLELDSLYRTFDKNSYEKKYCAYLQTMNCYQIGQLEALPILISNMISKFEKKEYYNDELTDRLNLNYIASFLGCNDDEANILYYWNVFCRSTEEAIAKRDYIMMEEAVELMADVISRDIIPDIKTDNIHIIDEILNALLYHISEISEVNSKENFIKSYLNDPIQSYFYICNRLYTLWFEYMISSKDWHNPNFVSHIENMVDNSITNVKYLKERLKESGGEFLLNKEMNEIEWSICNIYSLILKQYCSKNEVFVSEEMENEITTFVKDVCLSKINEKKYENLLNSTCESIGLESMDLTPKLEKIINSKEHKKYIRNNFISFDEHRYNELLKKKDYYNALNYLSNFTDAPWALRIIANFCNEGYGIKKNSELAIKYAKQAIKEGDNNAPLVLASAYINVGDFDNALKMYRHKDIDLDSRLLGEAWLYHSDKLGHYDLFKTFNALIKILEIPDVSTDRKEFVNRYLNQIASEANIRAYEEMYVGNEQQALKYIEISISVDPQELNYYDSRGEILLYFNHEKEAIREWEKIISLNPNFTNKKTRFYMKLKERKLIP